LLRISASHLRLGSTVGLGRLRPCAALADRQLLRPATGASARVE